MYKKILYAVQLDDANKLNIEKAIKYADTHNAMLHVVNVVSPLMPRYAYTGVYVEQEIQDGFTEGFRNLLRESVRPHPHVTSEILLGEPAEIITDYADKNDFDAILLNGHHHNIFGRFGSVAEKVVSMSKLDVIVFKEI